MKKIFSIVALGMLSACVSINSRIETGANPLPDSLQKVSKADFISTANSAAPEYSPKLWSAGSEIAMDEFRQKNRNVLEQMRVWHFGKRSTWGIGRVLHQNTDDIIAQKLRLDRNEIKKFRDDFYKIAANLQFSTNCYAYAVNDIDGHPPGWKPEPGEYSGYKRVTRGTYKNAAENFTARVEADGLIKAGVSNPLPLDGYYLTAFFLLKQEGKKRGAKDFHWLRQDRDGTWSHKLGHKAPTNLDSAGQLIANPQTADMDDFEFVSFFYVPEGGLDVGVRAGKSRTKMDVISSEDSFATSSDNAAVDLPHCVDSKGIKVRFKFKDASSVMRINFWRAMSVYMPMSGPVTYLDRKILKDPPAFIKFTAEHECMHHKLGHVRDIFSRSFRVKDLPTSAELHAYEMSADCAAVPQLQEKYNFTAKDLKTAFDTMPANNNSYTHPPSEKRLEHAISCLRPSS